jgi:hypothetical protein
MGPSREFLEALLGERYPRGLRVSERGTARSLKGGDDDQETFETHQRVRGIRKEGLR